MRVLGIGGVVLSGRRLLSRRPEEAEAPAPAPAPEAPKPKPASRPPARGEELVPGYYDEADGFHPLF
jgi:hypothetical protein